MDLALTDYRVGLFFFVFIITTMVVLALYGQSIGSFIFIAAFVYLFWVYSKGKISSKELFNMSFLPGGIAILPIIIILVFFVLPAMIMAWKMQKELIEAEKQELITQQVLVEQLARLNQNPITTAVEMFRNYK